MAAEPSEVVQRSEEPTPIVARNDNIRRLPVFYARVEIGGDYDGWWAEVRTNPPYSVLDQLNSNTEVYKGLMGLIKDHNFVDEEGNKIPLTEDGFKMIPVDLGLWTMQRWAEVRKLPPQPAGR